MEGCFWKLNKIVSKLFYHLEKVATLNKYNIFKIIATGGSKTFNK